LEKYGFQGGIKIFTDILYQTPSSELDAELKSSKEVSLRGFE
jgi:hypothetical protein